MTLLVRPAARRVVAAALAALTYAAMLPAAHAVTGPTPTPSATPTAGPSPMPSASPSPSAGPAELNPAEVQAQVAKANQLWAQISAANSQLAAVMAEASKLSERSNALLEQLDKAKEAQAAAEQELKAATDALGVLKIQLAESRRVMRQWAYSAYTEGEDNVQMLGILDALAHDSSRASDPIGDFTFITDQRSRAFTRVEDLTAKQVVLTKQATDAAAKAAAATTAIEQSKLELDAALDESQAKLTEVSNLQAAAMAQAAPVTAYLLNAKTPEAKAAAAKLQSAFNTPVMRYTGGATCSDNETIYPNGQLPANALCPLYGYPNDGLRPRAAAAFNAMSQAYAKQTGSPICITDSYRPLAEQYAVKAKKGKWAATPGYSQHGLGLAVDLCGGIENFGSAAHLWMKQNAPLFGWYHPAWAEPNGALPEPWHWQFAG